MLTEREQEIKEDDLFRVENAVKTAIFQNTEMGLRIARLVTAYRQLREDLTCTKETSAEIDNSRIELHNNLWELRQENERLKEERKALRNASIAAHKFLTGTGLLFSHRDETAVRSQLKTALDNLMLLENETRDEPNNFA